MWFLNQCVAELRNQKHVQNGFSPVKGGVRLQPGGGF